MKKDYILAAIFTLIPSSQVYSQSEKIRPHFGVGIYYYGIEISNLPSEIRNVPIHADDDYVDPRNAGPIKFTDYHKNLTFDLLPGIQWNFTKSLSANIGADWIFFSAGKLHERNYTNAVGTETRGYGAALTYCRIGIRGIVPATNIQIVDGLSNIAPKVGIEVKLLQKPSHYLSFESSIGYCHVVGLNGWDRYDALEKWKTYNLLSFIPMSAQISLGIPEVEESFWVISLGVQKMFIQKKESIFNDSNISFQFGDGIGFFITFVGT